MSADFCLEEVHEHLRRHPGEGERLFYWPELGTWWVNCRTCKATLECDEPECPPEQERAA